MGQIFAGRNFREHKNSRNFFISRGFNFAILRFFQILSRIAQFLIFREDLFSRMEAKSIFCGRNFRKFLEKNRETVKIYKNFSPRKFVPIKYCSCLIVFIFCRLPKDIAFLRKLKVLRARRNEIERIPEVYIFVYSNLMLVLLWNIHCWKWHLCNSMMLLFT